MADPSVRRADELVAELAELVETARAVPMSASCVVPREEMLDLLDALRAVLPPEVDTARQVLAERDALLAEAGESSSRSRAEAEVAARAERDRAAERADAIVADARHHADGLVRAAEEEAYRIVEAARAEHASLVSATTVHQSAHAAASRLRDEADDYAHRTRAAADEYAAAMRTDSDAYADRTLADLMGVLRQAQASTDQGRRALAARRASGQEVTAAAPQEG